MGVRECVSDLNPVTEGRFEREALASDQLVQRTPFDVLHDDVRLALEGANLMNRADIRVIELRGALRFAPKVKLRRRVAGAADNLQGYGAIEVGVVRGVDLAHPAGADKASDVVVIERAAGQDCGGLNRPAEQPGHG